MKIVISGSSGLIGSNLARHLLSRGHTLTRLVRPGGPTGFGYITWDPASGYLELKALEDYDAIIHLSGENIAARWTAEKKRRIYDSRINSTRLLCSRLRNLTFPPKVAILASAAGVYGDRNDEILTERSSTGTGFLAGLVQDWEAASQSLDDSKTRAVRLRTGVVISKNGGMLSRLLTPYRMGLGGKIGNGRQYISWVSMDDIMNIIDFALTKERLTGAVNAVAPNPVTNMELTRALARLLRRPAFMRIPAMVAGLIGGEMVKATLLASARIIPEKLMASGYQFIYPYLEDALKKELGK
jgi:uncharacterized protein (TIGR01777 family)